MFNWLQDVSVLTQFVVCIRRMHFDSLRLWNQSESGIQFPFYHRHYFSALLKILPFMMFLFPLFFLCLSSACIYFPHVFVVSDAWQASLLFLWKASPSLSNLTHTTVVTKFTWCFCFIFEFPTITLCRLKRKQLQNVSQLVALWRQNLIYPDLWKQWHTFCLPNLDTQKQCITITSSLQSV